MISMGAVRNNAAKPNGTVKHALIGIFSGFFLSIYGKVNCKGSKVLPSFTLIGAGERMYGKEENTRNRREENGQRQRVASMEGAPF
jgi:hypothetical protein